MSDATIEPPEAKHATYSYGDSSRPGVLLGFPLRQVLPVGIGVLVATLGLMSGLVVLVIVGPVVGAVFAFGRWRGAPLYEFAWPGAGLLWHRGRRRWTPVSLLAAGTAHDGELPKVLDGLSLVETSWSWTPAPGGGGARQGGRHGVGDDHGVDGRVRDAVVGRAGRDGEHVRGDVGIVRPAPESGDTGVLAGVVAPEGGGHAP